MVLKTMCVDEVTRESEWDLGWDAVGCRHLKTKEDCVKNRRRVQRDLETQERVISWKPRKQKDSRREMAKHSKSDRVR